MSGGTPSCSEVRLFGLLFRGSSFRLLSKASRNDDFKNQKGCHRSLLGLQKFLHGSGATVAGVAERRHDYWSEWCVPLAFSRSNVQLLGQPLKASRSAAVNCWCTPAGITLLAHVRSLFVVSAEVISSGPRLKAQRSKLPSLLFGIGTPC